MKDTRCFTAKKATKLKALKTGFRDLDAMTGGFFPGELICIAGRHSMGATGLTLSILRKVCVKEKNACLYFSLAESGRELVIRLNEKKAPLYLNETAFYIKTIEKTCKKKLKEDSIDLIVIDYYQLIKTKKDKDASLIPLRLKKLARNIKCPVIVLCQLDKSIDLRDDKRPLLSDLRSVSEMDQYADKVLLLYRDEYYNYDTDKKGTANVIVAKNNYGQGVGNVTLIHKGCGIFEDTLKNPRYFRRA